MLQFRAGKNVLIRDSWLYFVAPLAKLTKMFDIETEKSFFPHKLNSIRYINYKGDWPAPEDFAVKPDRREEFRSWYEKEKLSNPIYDFQQRLKDYCEIDVKLLYRACSKFRGLLLEHSNVDPLKNAMSIASLTAYIYRANFLRPNYFPLIADKNYGLQGQKNQSKIALRYLSWLAYKRYPDLIYAGNGNEYKVGVYSVDGYDPYSKTVIEVLGCFIHGHLDECHPTHRGVHPLQKNKTYEDVYEETMSRIDDIRRRDYRVIPVWTCEIEKFLRESEEMRNFFENIKTDMDKIINPRDGLIGGRCGSNILLAEINEEQWNLGYRIHYLDICSLYPYVMSNREFPIGHGKIINGYELHLRGRGMTSKEMNNYFGLIRAKIFPPTDGTLLFGALPYKLNDGRLCFPLCRKCADDNIHEREICEHLEEEDREWEGTFTTIEVRRALELGYRITRIYQIMHFEERSDNLFKDYVRTFAKLKHMSTGLPSNWSEQERKDFLEKLYEKEGVKLELDEIRENNPLREVAKRILNNLWVKTVCFLIKKKHLLNKYFRENFAKIKKGI